MLPYWRQKKARKTLIAEIKTTLSTPACCRATETGCHRRAVYRFYSAITTWGDSILSQAEIDALLNGDSEVKDEPTASVSGESDIRPYDPNTQRRVVRERLQALEIINERFARHFRMGLFNLLRRSPDITVGAIRIQPYHEFARNLPVPTNLNLIHLKPLRGTGLGGVLAESGVYRRG
ncbi:flagellar motor switch protein FliM [Escherichia coli]|nr:flagellar motor switch protein FliM [Escherichia coli]